METKKVNLRPMGNRVLLRPGKATTESDGGILIPEAYREKTQEATVVALGTGRREEGESTVFDVKPGDRVLVSKYGATGMTIDGEELWLVRQDDILAVLEGK